MHITVGIFGNHEAALEMAKKLGKKGTENDLSIYNHASSEGVFTYVCSNSDKLQPLLQAMSMADLPVLIVKELTKEVGEVIIALDEMNFETGFILADDSVRNQIEYMIKGMSLEKFMFTDESNLRPELIKYHPKLSGEEPMVPIDNYFNVKSVGTVILGFVKSGALKKYDKLMVEPLGKEVMIKGIQSQDRDLETTEPGMRVGLNLKGVEAEELKRGYVICKSMKKASEIKLKIKKNKFFKQELKPGFQLTVCSGLQTISCNIESIEGDIIKLKAVSPIAYKDGQRLLLASQNEILPRIIGSGFL